MSECLANLGRVTRRKHACQAIHLESSRVVKSVRGKEIWNGRVEVFELSDHPQASLAYAWTYKDKNDEMKYVAILNTPSISSPSEAVKSAIQSGQF